MAPSSCPGPLFLPLLLFFLSSPTLTPAAPAGGPLRPSDDVPHSHGHHVHLLHHHDTYDLTSHLPLLDAQQRAESFPLTATRLTSGSVFSEAQELNTAYLHYLDLDRLLFQFRHFAGLPNVNASGAPVLPYGGWESPDYVNGLINGHFTGHLLSALAFDAAGTGDGVSEAKGRQLVAELAKVQAAVAQSHPEIAGWFSAFGIDHLDRLDKHNATNVWAPYYTLHKLMAGLLDQYEQRSNTQALAVLESLAAYLHKRIKAVKADKGEAWWQVCLSTEFGGMNELGYNLYGHTKDIAHRELGDWFYKETFMDPLACGLDSLNGNHANQHLPQVVGVARGWEVTGNDTLANITATFHAILGEHYSYATGGSNTNEHWSSPDQLGDSILTTFDEATGEPHNSNGFHTEETCSQYNALKMLRHLFRWQPNAAIADDYEVKLHNGILGVQQPGVVGSLSYMTPLGRGVNRNQWDWWGFGSANTSFWCCYGSSIEQFAKLGDSIYFHNLNSSSPTGTSTSNASSPVLYVAQFIPSTLSWPEVGLQLTQTTRMQIGPAATACQQQQLATGAGRTCAELEVNVTLNALNLPPGSPDLDLRIRVPAWAEAGSRLVVLRDGKQVATITMTTMTTANATATLTPSTFAVASAPSGGWAPGDVVAARWTMVPRLKAINDQRPEYSQVAAIMMGPLVLGGLTEMDNEIAADPAKVAEWVVPATSPVSSISARSENGAGSDDGVLNLVAVGAHRNYTLVQLNRLVLEKYTVYFNVTG